jgi:hypothetical protein
VNCGPRCDLWSIRGSSRVNLTVVFVLVYGLTSFVAGYTSGAYYRSHFYPDPAPNWSVQLPASSPLRLRGTCWSAVARLCRASARLRARVLCAICTCIVCLRRRGALTTPPL